MNKIILLIASLCYLNSFTQDNINCDDILYQYQDLAKLHKESFIKYCEQIERKTIIKNTTLEQVTRNKQQFLANYLDFFMNNNETKTVLRSLAKSEHKGRECLKDELFRYDIKTNFLDLKDEIKLQVNQKYQSTIDYIFKVIIKKLKLDNTL